MMKNGVKFKDYLCFTKEWSGFDNINKINVVIGKNNSGKTCLLDLIKQISEFKIKSNHNAIYQFSGTLEENELKAKFRRETSGGALGGNHWNDHGIIFIGKDIIWEINKSGNVENFEFIDEVEIGSPIGNRSTEARKEIISEVLSQKALFLTGKSFRRLYSDRDIVAENPSNDITLYENGGGATNIIRKYLTSSNVRYPRELIQRELLSALNEIFGDVSTFSEITVQEHDETGGKNLEGKWEIYFEEPKKGLISLSRSGSGFKTIILVLLNLFIALNSINGDDLSSFIFAFEELENNVHPSLLRRLLKFIEDFCSKHRCIVFLTTHSNVVLDFFYGSQDAQIVKVIHNGEYACTRTILSSTDRLAVISDLGAKPSDLMQSNGILWVEGPSDRIYINKWIEIFGEGKLCEGKDYQCAFFGGALLADYQFIPEEEATENLANLFNINPNVILVADGDRTASSGPGSKIKGRVRKIVNQIKGISNSYHWITSAKEIENYIPAEILAIIHNKPILPEIGQYEYFSHNPIRTNQTKGYIQKNLNKKSYDKIELALKSAIHFTQDNLSNKFDLKKEMRKICMKIEKWNSSK